MVYIVNEGKIGDPRSIPLSTCDGSHIPNFRKPEATREARRQIATELKRDHEHAKLRSSSSTYNCIGHVFASRRTWVESDHLPTILTRDSYSQLSDKFKLSIGDIIVYENAQGEPTHVAQVMTITDNLADATRRVIVLSKWGEYGEYIHDLDDVPLRLGSPKTFWTEKRDL